MVLYTDCSTKAIVDVLQEKIWFSNDAFMNNSKEFTILSKLGTTEYFDITCHICLKLLHINMLGI